MYESAATNIPGFVHNENEKLYLRVGLVFCVVNEVSTR